MGKHVIGQTDEFVEGTIKVVSLEGKSIGVVYARGNFYALRNLCPHQGGPLCGGVFPALKAAIQPNGRIREYHDHDEPVVACPWHGWEFDVKTGECLADRSRRVATYETSVEDNAVAVIIP
ncbi:Rieske (2Fe-2S) protein [Paenibacillus xerothermodurans]|uniref:Rieske (2Fe-2S) protein n=1 Tax=Paenibacillus xerothermodurans TaxID=1977292 RepID=A0A2W1NAJ7_PAEXE|nr:Rieske (2Fe-2S) protein [Paenibacillus xerothermodurans]PZE21689.1 Rieske (2Fe-2S) protein [Paenibacillus xerothermodurans]